MPDRILFEVVYSILSLIVEMLLKAGHDPQHVILEMLDEHPLLAEKDRVVESALRDKFGDENEPPTG